MEEHLDTLLAMFHSLLVDHPNVKLVVRSTTEDTSYEATYTGTEGGFHILRKEESAKAIREGEKLFLDKIDRHIISCWNLGNIWSVAVINK
jgi:hypothetical protein